MASSESETGSQAGLQGAAPRPVNLPHIESLDVAARYHPARCGGDFFDAVAPDSRVLFMLTDIAGRRPETQAIAVEIQNVFRTRAQDLFEDLDANESEGIGLLARDINRSLIEAARGVRFAPAFLGCYNLTLNILTYQYAGHFLALFHDGEKTRVLEPCGIPLGLFTHSTYEPAILAFDRHAKLLLVTKGITEDRQGGTVFDDERISLLLENSTTDSASICEAVLRVADDSENHPKSRALLRSRKQKYRDDLTAVALVRRGDTPDSAHPPER
ncbi:MAG TPA: PP2C family protein-serine/threonine phosphatase [Acidobacteriaceae bacterium]|nr:PP2C family protein-serine/threonine phosphatase [Acidobacteriaceae bacterium]